jgi:F-type H+-transporting ATPase subunit b
MRISTKVVGWSATVAVVFALASSRSCWAQTATESAKELAHEAAEEAMVEEAGGEPSGGPNPLAIDPDLAIWTAVVFLLLLLFLGKFAWPQIATAIDERERKIAADIAAAKALQEDAKRLRAEHEAKLAATAGEIREMLEEARRDAEHTKNIIVAEARKAAEGEKDRAVLEINRAKEGAIHDLAVHTANVAIDIAEGVTAKQLSTERNNELIREAMNKLAAVQPSKN